MFRVVGLLCAVCVFLVSVRSGWYDCYVCSGSSAMYVVLCSDMIPSGLCVLRVMCIMSVMFCVGCVFGVFLLFFVSVLVWYRVFGMFALLYD